MEEQKRIKDMQRRTTDGHWCWANKDTLRFIRRELKRRGIKHMSSYLAIYHALTEIASNERKEEFSCKQSEIAKRSGCGTSTISKGLKILNEIGVIESERSLINKKEYGIPYHLTPPNKYTMLRVERNYAFAGGDNGDAIIGDYYIRRRKEEEKEKEFKLWNYSDSFNQLWQIYPKKLAKGDAWQVFELIDPSEELLQKMIESVKIFSTTSDWVKDGGTYVPYLRAWLERQRWDDEPKEEELSNNDTYRPRGGW